MTAAAAWRWCLAAGIATDVAGVAFGWIHGLAPCGPSGNLGAIMAFELARTPAEIAALFGEEPCRSALVAGQGRALLLDGLAFIPAYTAFLIFAAVALDGRVAAKVAIVATLFAAILDQIEGGILYAILRHLPGTPGIVTLLYWETRTKFVALGIASLIIAGLLAANRRLGAVAAMPVAIGAVFSLWFALVDMHAPQMMLGYRVSWTTLLIFAAIGSVKPRAFARIP